MVFVICHMRRAIAIALDESERRHLEQLKRGRRVPVRLPDNTEERGGLAVVVGAVEVTLLDLVNGYATLGRGGIRRIPRLFRDEVT